MTREEQIINVIIITSLLLLLRLLIDHQIRIEG